MANEIKCYLSRRRAIRCLELDNVGDGREDDQGQVGDGVITE